MPAPPGCLSFISPSWIFVIKDEIVFFLGGACSFTLVYCRINPPPVLLVVVGNIGDGGSYGGLIGAARTFKGDGAVRPDISSAMMVSFLWPTTLPGEILSFLKGGVFFFSLSPSFTRI